jgi:hypothetical protein
MTKILLNFFLLLSTISFGQNSRQELAHSKIYVHASFYEQKNVFLGLQFRTDLVDTVLNDNRFVKFKMDYFQNSSQIDSSQIYYETFENGRYQLLNQRFETIHSVDYKTDKRQKGILYGNEQMIDFVPIDNEKIEDQKEISQQTPRKYYQKNDAEIYVVIIADIQTLAVYGKDHIYTKQMLGKAYNELTSSMQQQLTVNNRFDIQVGDELQILYRRKWYDQNTGEACYRDKQYKTIKCKADTIIQGNRELTFQIDGFNYLNSQEEQTEEYKVILNDTGYYLDNRFVRFQDFRTELKLADFDGKVGLDLSGVFSENLDGYNYTKVFRSASDLSMRSYLLPFYPITITEFGNVEGHITYIQSKGQVYGQKMLPIYDTTQNYLRSIQTLDQHTLQLKFFSLGVQKMNIIVFEKDEDKQIASLDLKIEKGLNTFVVPIPGMEKDQYYRLNISYKSKEESGSISTGFKAKF